MPVPQDLRQWLQYGAVRHRASHTSVVDSPLG